MQKSCFQCEAPFEIFPEDEQFYRKITVPAPTLCPTCRHVRRHGFINDYVFYPRSCDSCKKSMVSIFPPKSEYRVICHECWYSEGRDDQAEGVAYDENKSFFEQFDQLMKKAPHMGISWLNCENCDYCQSVGHCKNCYLVSESSNCEDCLFGYWIQKTKSSLDCAFCHECEECYQVTDSSNCYNITFSSNCMGCSDSVFLDNCTDCKHCAFSTNLRHQEYYLFNKSYSREEYEKTLKSLELEKEENLKKYQHKFFEWLKTQPRKACQIDNAENCTGDYIRNAKNCRIVFHCYEAEDCAYGEHVWRNAKECMDSNTAGRDAELLYETTNCGIGSYQVKFSRYCWGSQFVEYSNQCVSCANLFGCVSLKPKSEYCILNKQYSKTDYESLRAKIMAKMRADKEYGEFFPLTISLFGFNTTMSYEELPLSQKEVKARGWKWEDQQSGSYGKSGKDIRSCVSCQRNYKLIPQELAFYQQHGLPIPSTCPFCRHSARLAGRRKKLMHETSCFTCKKRVISTLDPAQYQHILCESCYQTTFFK